MAATMTSADREKVAQVVDNLISNAVKYSSSGNMVQLTARLRSNKARPAMPQMATQLITVHAYIAADSAYACNLVQI